MNRMLRLLAVVGCVAVIGFVLLQALPAGAVAGAMLQGPPGYQQGPPPPPPPLWDPSFNRRPLPPVGACFYTDYNFRGNRFCMNRGVSYPSLPGGYGNNISSVQIFGRAQVRIFNDSNFRNGSTVLRHTVADLRHVPFVNGHTWNNRVSSIQIF